MKKKAAYFLFLIAFLISLFVIDSFNPPNKQCGSIIAINVIEFYQKKISNKMPYIKCRYKVSCSIYSKNEIKKNGVYKGAWICIKRLSRCF